MELSLLLLVTPEMPETVVPAGVPPRPPGEVAVAPAPTGAAPLAVPTGEAPAARRDSRWRRDLPRGLGACGKSDRDEFVVGDWILEFLAKEFLIDEHIETGRQSAGPVLALEQADRPGVLFPPKHELDLFFTLGDLLPYRHGSGHQDGHDAETDDQHHHRVAVVDSCATAGSHRISGVIVTLVVPSSFRRWCRAPSPSPSSSQFPAAGLLVRSDVERWPTMRRQALDASVTKIDGCPDHADPSWCRDLDSECDGSIYRLGCEATA